MASLVALATILALCTVTGANAVVERTHVPLEKNVQGLIQAGYPRERAEEALRAVGNENCCEKQIHWLFEQNKKRAVEDKNIGPLIKTVMTRCIHCTRFPDC